MHDKIFFIAVALFSILLFVALALIPIFFCRSMRKTMAYVPTDKSLFPSIFIWCTLIPFVGIIFQWLMFPFGIPDGLKNIVTNNDAAVRDTRSIKLLGYVLQVLATITYVLNIISLVREKNIFNQTTQPFFPMYFMMVLCSIVIFIVWIIYWVKVVQFRKKYLEA